jgi:hypothetical protein
MREMAMLDGRELASAVERLTDRFASACGTGAQARQVRVLAHELVLDVVGALRRASIGDIAEAVAVLERHQKSRAASPVRLPIDGAHDRGLTGAAAKRAASPTRAYVDSAPALPPSPRKSRDPFDITKPGELLDPPLTESRRDEEQPPSSVRRTFSQRSDRERQGILAPSKRQSASTPADNAEPPAARPPVVTLREGEQLLRTGGSGVVIRRARSA